MVFFRNLKLAVDVTIKYGNVVVYAPVFVVQEYFVVSREGDFVGWVGGGCVSSCEESAFGGFNF